MPRQLRNDPEGAWHHVMNRGVDHHTVFRTAADAELFLDVLADSIRRFGVEVHAFCLMPNHFHLLVFCPEGGLGRFMQHLSARFTQFANHRSGRDGPLFRGRYRSLLLADAEHVDNVERYIHLNPADRVPPPRLDEYRWSSLRYHLGVEPAPAWLATAWIAQRYASVDSHRTAVLMGSDP